MRHLPNDIVVNWWNKKFENEARIEGAKRLRIEDEALEEPRSKGEGEARVAKPQPRAKPE